MKASIPSFTSATARLLRLSTNSEMGRGEASFRNGRPVERKLSIEHCWNEASLWFRAELGYSDKVPAVNWYCDI